MPDFRSSPTPPRPLLLLGTLALIEDHWVLSSVAGSSELPSGEEAAGLTKRKNKKKPGGGWWAGRKKKEERKRRGWDDSPELLHRQDGEQRRAMALRQWQSPYLVERKSLSEQ